MYHPIPLLQKGSECLIFVYLKMPCAQSNLNALIFELTRIVYVPKIMETKCVGNMYTVRTTT